MLSLESDEFATSICLTFTDAAIVGQLKMVKMLVDRGADVTFKNRKGKSPVDVASSAVYDYLVTAQGKSISFDYFNENAAHNIGERTVKMGFHICALCKACYKNMFFNQIRK